MNVLLFTLNLWHFFSCREEVCTSGAALGVPNLEDIVRDIDQRMSVDCSQLRSSDPVWSHR